MSRRVEHVQGLRELQDALSELPRATSRSVRRRVLIEAGEPIARAARAKAPRDSGELQGSIAVSTKLSRRQRRLYKKQSEVEVYVGAGALPHAHLAEFGSYKDAPQPFMRPAWDEQQDAALDVIKARLGEEIEKAAARHAKKMARQARKAAKG